jgi:hypothetical protein
MNTSTPQTTSDSNKNNNNNNSEVMEMIRQLTLSVQSMQQQLTQQQAQHRRDIITNSRQSLFINNTPTNNYSSSPIAPPIVTNNPSTFERRLSQGETSDNIPSTPTPNNNRDELKVNTAPINYNNINNINNNTSTMRSEGGIDYSEDKEGLDKLAKKAEKPDIFYGDTNKDKIDPRSWVESANSFLNTQLDPSKQGGRLKHVIPMTGGIAQQWLIAKRDETMKLVALKQLDRPAEWIDLQQPFIEYLEGPQARTLLRTELDGLRLGKGNCKDLISLNSEFDRIRIRLFPNSNTIRDVDSYCGEEYGKVILRSDKYLWNDVMKMGLSNSLDEWKTKTATAWAARQSYIAVTRSSGDNNSSYRNNNSTERNGFGNRNNNNNTPNRSGITTHNMDVDERETLGERPEDQADNRVSVQSTSANRPRPPRGWRDTNNKHISFTDTELSALSKNRRCFICYSKDHRGFCPNFDNRPRRKPNAEELKA